MMGCNVTLEIKKFVNNITNISIFYNGYTYDKSKVNTSLILL